MPPPYHARRGAPAGVRAAPHDASDGDKPLVTSAALRHTSVRMSVDQAKLETFGRARRASAVA
jgi:hypothetical protein